MLVIDASIDLINPSADIMLSAAELALKKKITIYDACYLTLAQELDIQLITADEKLYNSTKELRCLELLSNY